MDVDYGAGSLKDVNVVLTHGQKLAGSVIADFYEAWQFLHEHPIFQYQDTSHFTMCLSIDAVKVNPATELIDDDHSKNTATRIWLECGPWNKPEDLDEVSRPYHPFGTPSHDYDLDCGGPKFDEVIVKLANLVREEYGDYRT